MIMNCTVCHLYLPSTCLALGDYLREKYDEATQVKLNKRGYLQVKDSSFKVPTANDLVYLDESPDWCRNTRQLQWTGKNHNDSKSSIKLLLIRKIVRFVFD